MARVLILLDDLAALAFVRQSVRAAGHEALSATSAADARAALDAASPPEVVLVDPRADAGEALALAKELSESRRSRAAVLVLGDATHGAPTAASVPTPVVAATLAARISDALAARPAESPRDLGATAPRAQPAPARGRADDLRDRISAGSRPPTRPEIDIDALAGLARTRDYFQVLGVPRAATSIEIREAAAHLLAELDAHRLRVPGPSPDLEDIRQVVLDARDVLADERLRALYLEGIAP